MHIHWFPGHMTKAIRMMKEEMPLVDGVIYVLDARIPLSSINTAFDEVIGNKPRLYILNKCDLTDRAELESWRQYFLSAGMRCMAVDSLNKAAAPEIVKNLKEMNAALIERYAARGVKKTIRAMVIGVPNTGKSTLINSLVKEKKTMTGNRPGVTRGKQWVSIDPYIELLDSPGVLYPDFRDQEKAVNLALAGCIKDDILDTSELAAEGIRRLRRLYPALLAERYKLAGSEETPAEILEAIGKARGVVGKGGSVDLERAAKAFITDFRKGYIGKMILDTRDAGSFTV